MRKGHIISGLITLGLGLFLAYLYSPQVVEFLKGALQPIFILIGLMALAFAVFGNTEFQKVNLVLAAVFLVAGLYGLYDEYYAVVDLISGLSPPLLIVFGLVAVVHGIRSLT